MITAIETKYNNHKFRSRLEARFALLFDTLGVQWLYESEGYDLGGEWYLPDFYFPEFYLFAEIKPVALTYKEHRKCKLLAVQSESKVIELVGLPSLEYMDVIIPLKMYVCSKCGFEEQYDDNKRVYCSCKAKHEIRKSITQIKGIPVYQKLNNTTTAILFKDKNDSHIDYNRIKNAIIKAKEARF